MAKKSFYDAQDGEKLAACIKEKQLGSFTVLFVETFFTTWIIKQKSSEIKLL